MLNALTGTFPSSCLAQGVVYWEHTYNCSNLAISGMPLDGFSLPGARGLCLSFSCLPPEI